MFTLTMHIYIYFLLCYFSKIVTKTKKNQDCGEIFFYVLETLYYV
jgi:hypothetical protein